MEASTGQEKETESKTERDRKDSGVSGCGSEWEVASNVTAESPRGLGTSQQDVPTIVVWGEVDWEEGKVSLNGESRSETSMVMSAGA